MKILTVWEVSLRKFDEKVNNALSEGYTLVRREVFPAERNLEDSILYAELILPDKPNTAPDKVDLVSMDPTALAEAIRAICSSVKMTDCRNGRCPLAAYCDAICDGKIPEDWPAREEVSK